MKKKYKIIGIIFLIFVAIGVIAKEDKEPKKKETKEVVEKVIEKNETDSNKKMEIISNEDGVKEIDYILDNADKEFFYSNETNKKIVKGNLYFSEEEFLMASYAAMTLYQAFEVDEYLVVNVYNGNKKNADLKVIRFIFNKKKLEETKYASFDIINIYRRYLVLGSDSGVGMMTNPKGSKALYSWDGIELIMSKYSDYDPEDYK